VLAGDWIALPVPAMLMEAAVTSGLAAANAILRQEGVREEPVYSVPLRGLLARSPRRTRYADGQR
jgi:isorenieratene synthase